MNSSYLLTFLVGGTIVSAVKYIANELKNPACAAIAALLPIGFLCGYIIDTRNTLVKYIHHISLVMAVTVLVAVCIYLALIHVTVHKCVILTAGILLWFGCQYGLYNFTNLNTH